MHQGLNRLGKKSITGPFLVLGLWQGLKPVVFISDFRHD